MNEKEIRTLRTVETTCNVLQALHELNGGGVTEIAEHLGLSKGAAYNHLATLKEQDYVRKEDGVYKLGFRLVNLGKSVKNQSELYTVGKQYLDQLAEETGEYAHMMVEHGGLGYYLYRSKGDKAIATEFHEKKSEKPDHLHHSSTGKAILAELPQKRVEDIIEEHGMPATTENTITSREELFNELEATQKRGYAIYDEEEVTGTRAVGTSITDGTKVYGAISVSGPVSRMEGKRFEKELPQRIQNIANLIEIDLQTSSNKTQVRAD